MTSLNGVSEQGKRLIFEVLSHVDSSVAGPRLGRLSLPGREDLLTPGFFAVGSRGVVPHITPDVITSHTNFGGVHMALEDFIERANKDTPPILNTPGTSPIHSFTSLPQNLFTLLAPRRTPAVSAPNGNSNTAISVFTSTGFQTVSNKTYISYIEGLRPDIAIGLADVPYGTQPGTKRIAKMGDRTQEWLSQLLKEKIEGQAVFAPVLPIDFLDQSEYIYHVAEDLANQIAGLAFYDSNVLPDVPATSMATRLPRLSLDEPSSPRQIIRQVSLGMDMFTVPFIGFATDAGIALSFRFPRSLPAGTSPTHGTEILPLGIDMWPESHATSLEPLSTSCTCYTCTDYHRAFLRHLLSAKEMLGWVLLQIHNHHVLSEFFAAIRESIKNGTFNADCDEFSRMYEPELPGKSGQGPRVRGYHFKSEGPGQAKKNKSSWGNFGSSGQEGTALVPDEPAS
ncbi:tRNA-guanine transglycosylase family protein [Drepanopeziza brunnea f. sp. 'multigermtubi' MB_m1]|uniref:Queuine tRNA-ribosyltransferase accessory subunit 2 n=1 Tax=Marssonina brunnea f. sp. multigermtubi (strain MB_m1) TaxID=1072389 RepID=K1WP82_MARBU|nr:tRNA-guanine transglycosylase family protein [Drepanopeziza brunnea f. sp. 'multigermtubi' MB_m1]EKD19475.1 tRNA-guanine transglycosylase family protein [Drepanopeziza brunnea f. sp. 'multigermtubi' MB_m1]